MVGYPVGKMVVLYETAATLPTPLNSCMKWLLAGIHPLGMWGKEDSCVLCMHVKCQRYIYMLVYWK